MITVKAIYDGQDVKSVEPIPLKEKVNVLVVFPDISTKYSPQEARRLLRGSGSVLLPFTYGTKNKKKFK